MARVKTSIRTSSGRRTTTGPFRAVGQSAEAFLKTLSLPSDEQVVVRFPFAPRQMTFDNITVNTAELRRPDKKPLLVIENPQLRTCTFNVVIADKQSGGALSRPVTDVMERLEQIAANGYDCKFSYGLLALSYSVKITRLTFEVQQLNSDGEPIKVQAQIQLTESPGYNPELVALDVVYYTPDIIPTVPSDLDILDEDSTEEFEHVVLVGDIEVSIPALGGTLSDALASSGSALSDALNAGGFTFNFGS